MPPFACIRRKSCRLCGSGNLVLVLQLEPTPPANAFVTASQLMEEQHTFPLDVFFCQDCTHVQLLDVVNPEALFEEYVYVSGTSLVFVEHFRRYAETISARYTARPTNSDLIIDIGSNDGTLLKEFKGLGFSVLGIDPAKEIARRATENGIETIPKFFSLELAKEIRQERGAAKIITANNVYAHTDDMIGITEGIRALLALNGVFVFEVSYLVDVFEKTLFDTIYHEHLAYHSVKPLVDFFKAHGMELIAAERVSSHGGSLRGVAQLQGGRYTIDSSVSDMLNLEDRLLLDQVETLRAFGTKISEVKQELTEKLHELKTHGMTIAGFGAPAKATTLMYHFGIGPDVIDFIVDDNPQKHGLFSPGMHVPIWPAEAIYSKRPEAVIILAWNFAQPIMRDHVRYIQQGGQFIVPLPNLEIFD